VVTVDFGATAHGFKVGQVVLATFAAGDTDVNEFDNGNKTITSVETAFKFTYDETDSDYTSLGSTTYTTGPATCTLYVYLDDNAAAGDTIRLYRSESVTPSTSTPPEDAYQVYEALLSATNISNGYIAITDNTPEVLLGEPLYTSPGVEGEAGSNDKPPRAVDVCTVGGSLMLGNLRYKHTLDMRLLATGGSAGIIDGTQITITDGTSPFTMTAETGTIAAGEFPLYISTSPAQDAERTAQALVDAINTYASNTIVDAFYISSATDPSGMIRLVKRDWGTTGFTVLGGRGSAWNPVFSTDIAAESRQEISSSSVALSKPGIPDAFPPLSRFEVGEPNEKVLRVLPVRDNKCVIIKERSCWLMSGVWPNIRIDLIDDTLSFAFPDTAAVLDGTVYVLSSVGVVGISESGVASVGGPVAELTEFLEDEELNFTTADAWGVVDKALGVYLLFLGSEADSDTTSRALVYSPGVRAWSGPWVVDWTAYGRLISTGQIAVGLPDAPRLALENTAGCDVRGNSVKTVVTRPTATTITVADASDVHVGDTLTWTVTIGPSSTTRRAVVTAVSGVTLTLNVSHLDYFTEGVSTVGLGKAFECIAEPVPLHSGGSGADSQAQDVVLLMDRQRFESANVSVSGGDVGQAYKSSKTLSRWGWGGTEAGESSVPYGERPWGDYNGIRPERCSVPAESQRAPFHCVRFTIREAGAKWRLHGVQVEFEPGSVKGRR
jgi:hypothetical protein